MKHFVKSYCVKVNGLANEMIITHSWICVFAICQKCNLKFCPKTNLWKIDGFALWHVTTTLEFIAIVKTYLTLFNWLHFTIQSYFLNSYSRVHQHSCVNLRNGKLKSRENFFFVKSIHSKKDFKKMFLSCWKMAVNTNMMHFC